MSIEMMNLFKRSLNDFQAQTLGLPVRFNRTMLLWYTSYHHHLVYDYEDTDKSINMLAAHIFEISKSTNEAIFNIYLNLIYIDKLFDHMIANSKEYVSVNIELDRNPLMRDDKDYWLFDLPPKLLSDESVFIEGVHASLKIWREKSAELRDATEKITLFTPKDENAMNLSFVMSRLEKA